MWERESDTAVVGSLGVPPDTAYSRPLLMDSRQPFTPPYQLEVDVEELRGGTITGVGVTIGQVALDGGHASSGRFCFSHMHAVGVDDGTQENRKTQMDTPTGMNWTEPKYHLDVRVWPQSLLFLVNDTGPRGTVLGGNFDPGERFGFGGRYELAGRVRFSNVRIRKLPYNALLNMTSHEQLIAESTRMVELDPDDWFARWIRGSSNFELKKYEEALTDFSALERTHPNHQGALYMLAAAYAKTGNIADALEKVKVAHDANPQDYRVIRLWAELEIKSQDPQRDLEGALKRAQSAYSVASRDADAWRYQLTVAEAHAELGDLTAALKKLESVGTVMDPVGNGEVQARLYEFRQRKRNSYQSAIASLLWEGDMTRRILGLVLAVILLAANLLVIRKVAMLGRLYGAAAGLVGVAISIGIPCVLAIFFGMGEGPAFIKLLSAIVGVAAIFGAIGGVCSAGAKEPTRTDAANSEPLLADVADGQRDDK